MADQRRRKRRAEEQLSPYTPDELEAPVHEAEAVEEPAAASVPRKRARASRTVGMAPVNKEALKGVLGKVSLSGEAVSGVRTDDLFAGLNKSFLKAVSHVIEKQSNKDLTFLFSQYQVFASEINDGKVADKREG